MKNFGRMNKRSWNDIFFPLRNLQPKHTKSEHKRWRKFKSLFTVEKQSFGGIQTLEYEAFTKSEARAAYKREYGRIPPGTVFTKVA